MNYIVVYSGSFDPVHRGHLALAQYVLSSPQVDALLLMVTPHNPLKPELTHASFDHRCRMAELAIKGMEDAEVSGFEATLTAPHFTYATLSALQRVYPESKLNLLIGADNWQLFSRWRNPQEIIDQFGLLIYPRPGVEVDSALLPAGVTYMADAPQDDVSSTQIRQMLAQDLDPGTLLHPDVYQYIKRNSLYDYGRKKS